MTNKQRFELETMRMTTEGYRLCDYVQSFIMTYQRNYDICDRIWEIRVDLMEHSAWLLAYVCMTLTKETPSQNHLTGQPCFMIPDFAIAILSKEPPSAAKCSSPIVVMIDVASPELGMTLVASRAPPNPACSFKVNKLSTIVTFSLSLLPSTNLHMKRK